MVFSSPVELNSTQASNRARPTVSMHVPAPSLSAAWIAAPGRHRQSIAGRPDVIARIPSQQTPEGSLRRIDA